ncbi:MAG: hypothetical protein AAF634_02610 [Bacteroidota bacterium]
MSFISKSIPLFFLSATWHLSLLAQLPTTLDNISFYDSLEEVKTQIGNDVLSQTVLALEQPIFPLAKELETHLLCTNLKTANGTLAQVVFTFADNQLQYIEARGGAISTLLDSQQDTLITFMHYQASPENRIFAVPKKDQVWMVSPEAAHCNLFAWENPYLTANGPAATSYLQSAAIPDFIEMGGEFDRLRPLLEANSSFVYERKLDGSDPNAQIQLDCFGVEYAGFPRKVEARFGNGKLNTVWILTGKGEEDRIRQKLQERYGAPVFTNADWEIFENWTVGLRKDKPEVLLLTPELGQFYKTEFFKQ